MSANFSYEELTNSTSFPDLVYQNMIDARAFEKQLKYTAGTLEEIRAILNVPMKITSGFRNGVLNKAVGGSPTSGHTKGLCADIVPIGMTVTYGFEIILARKDECPSLKKCIIEKVRGSEWLHIETKTEVNQPQQFFSTNNGKSYTEIKV